MGDVAPFALHLAGNGEQLKLGADLNATREWPRDKPLLRVCTVQVNTQQDAKEVTWLGPAGFLRADRKPPTSIRCAPPMARCNSIRC